MDNYKQLSKFLSLVLRHRPELAGITLDEHGWADADLLIAGISNTGRKIDKKILEEIVKADEKGRYKFDDTHARIRANQGHSISIDVELKEAAPPEFLYHGTATRFLDKIRKEGLKPMGRLYVHLSLDCDTAETVGKRHGRPAGLKVKSGQMSRAGIKFYLSENGVWLTEKVPKTYLEVLSGEGR